MTNTPPDRQDSFLDRPVFAGKKLTWWTLLYVAFIAFIVGTRLWNLAPRGYSHDESIHAWEAWKLVTGQGYTHSPVYHGPFLYHFTALLFALFGHTDFVGRLSPALFGIAITLMPLLMTKWLGKKGVLATTFLMAVSPVMMHRSRFLRHDPYVALFNLILFVSIWRYLDERKERDLYIVAGAVALGFTAKETTFITYAIFGVFLAALALVRWLRSGNRTLKGLTELPVFDLIIVIGTLILPLATPFPIRLLGHDPVDYSTQGIIFSGSVFAVVLAISAAIGIWWNWRRWLVCAGIFYGIFVPLFTTMFTNPVNGFATGMVGQLGYWLSQQEVKRGGQPWFYYLVLMPMYEFSPLLIGAASAVYAFLRFLKGTLPSNEEAEQLKSSRKDEVGVRERPDWLFVGMLIWWFCAAFVLYSWAGEKMPWLTMHLAIPLHLLAGWGLGRLIDVDWTEIRAKGGLWLLLLVPLILYTLIKFLTSGISGQTTTADLNQSMGWLLSLVTLIVLVGLAWRQIARLGARHTWRMVALACVVVLVALTVRFAWMATFINADMATEFLVYAQGAPDVNLVTREIETMSRRLTGGLHMKVAYDDDSSWPFVWYLRDFTNAQFYGKKPGGPFDAEVVIVGPANEASVKPLLGNKYYRRQYRLIWWPNQDWYNDFTPKNLWQDLTDPVAREKFWDVVWNRKHEASVTSWPFVHNFALYVRRDVAQQLWDYGPEALVASGPLPGDEYVEKWRQVSAQAVWGSAGKGPGQFTAPKGMAFDAEGNLYVADSHNHRIQVLDSSGAHLRSWGSEGNQPGQFKEPWGVAVAPDGEVYVCDTWNHRVQVFDAEGRFLRMWGTFGEVSAPTGSGTAFYGPRDIVLDAEGNLYVSDTGNKRVVKYDGSGRMISATGGFNDVEGLFQEPVGLAISANGVLYVADTWNQRIQAFDLAMNPLRQWSVYAWDGMSVVNKPYLATNDAGHVFVTDPEGYRVLEFDPEGGLVSSWGQYGSDMSSMNLPTGVLVGPDGRLYVSDSENNRIMIFAQ